MCVMSVDGAVLPFAGLMRSAFDASLSSLSPVYDGGEFYLCSGAYFTVWGRLYSKATAYGEMLCTGKTVLVLFTV